MRWLVGIDLAGRSTGALTLAAWLVRNSKSPTHLVAVHVIDEQLWGPHDVSAALRPSCERALAEELAPLGLSSDALSHEVLTARTVPKGLALVAAQHGCDGIIVGRIAPRHGRTVVRLGSVARRLLRDLPLPVMVVPSDFSATDIGDGALLLGTDIGESSRSAGATAVRIGRELERSLVLVHVDPSYSVVPDYIGGGAVIVPRTPRHVRADVEHWAAASQLDVPVMRLADGEVVEELIAQGRREASPMIVVGSRRLTLGERLFSSSVGSDLARFADRPVLVVPGGD
jgi:nucleotide-binding universal stress UspA family protein